VKCWSRIKKKNSLEGGTASTRNYSKGNQTGNKKKARRGGGGNLDARRQQGFTSEKRKRVESREKGNHLLFKGEGKGGKKTCVMTFGNAKDRVRWGIHLGLICMHSKSRHQLRINARVSSIPTLMIENQKPGRIMNQGWGTVSEFYRSKNLLKARSGGSIGTMRSVLGLVKGKKTKTPKEKVLRGDAFRPENAGGSLEMS